MTRPSTPPSPGRKRETWSTGDRADRGTAAAADRAARDGARRTADDGAANRILSRRLPGWHQDRQGEQGHESQSSHFADSPIGEGCSYHDSRHRPLKVKPAGRPICLRKPSFRAVFPLTAAEGTFAPLPGYWSGILQPRLGMSDTYIIEVGSQPAGIVVRNGEGYMFFAASHRFNT